MNYHIEASENNYLWFVKSGNLIVKVFIHKENAQEWIRNIKG